MAFPRYAVYFLPPADTPLYRFGAGVIGYDAFSGRLIPFPDSIAGKIGDWKDLTADPRKYGFHATLKAPISLAQEYDENGLIAALSRFAAIPRAIPVIAPVVRMVGSFIAVVHDAPSPALQILAGDCVSAFDTFRAPLTVEDRLRRKVPALTEQQIANLDRWGYPYVFEEFRFHMTLTGPIHAKQRETILGLLQNEFCALNLPSVAIDHIGLLRQDTATSSFEVMELLPLTRAIQA